MLITNQVATAPSTDPIPAKASQTEQNRSMIRANLVSP
jgi:hypothetical protein